MARRLRRRPNINPTLGQCIVFSGNPYYHKNNARSNFHYLDALGHWSVFSYKLRYTVCFGLVDMAISTNPKPTIYRNLYENMGSDDSRTHGNIHLALSYIGSRRSWCLIFIIENDTNVKWDLLFFKRPTFSFMLQRKRSNAF